MIELLNVDCMDYMKTLPDKAFDLAVVDPPYNISRLQKLGVGSRIDKTGKMNSWNRKVPSKEYFENLFRVSKNQIIWGANNYHGLPPTEYFCIWNKLQTVRNFSSAEYAWVSMGLKSPAKVFTYGIHQHNADGGKIHPTQKPVKLYQWILRNYAEPGQKILDTHLGSGSSAIAAHYFGCDFVGCEIDKDYYKAAVERFDDETKQLQVF